MATVDPWLVPIPKAFQEDPELLAYIEQLHRFLFDLWQRSGGSESGITQIVDVISGEPDAELPDGSSGPVDDDPAVRNPYSLWNGLVS